VDDSGRREGERPSAFTPILCDLVRSTAGACGAVFTDRDGECVDYFSHITPFDLKVIGAHASLLVSLLAQDGVVISGPLAFSGSRLSLWILPLGEGYTLTLAMERRTWSGDMEGALDRAWRALRSEAGIRLRPGKRQSQRRNQ